MANRMEDALRLADKCWGKAYRSAPEFVERYFVLSEQLLLSRPVAMGDEFRSHAKTNLLFLPVILHHNTWVSGVRALQTLGWIAPISKVEPVQTHNHMPLVTLWKSAIYGGKSPSFLKQYELVF